MSTTNLRSGGVAERLALYGPQILGIGGFYLAALIFFTVSADNFFTSSNAVNILSTVSVIGVVSLGQALVLISGGFDLSVSGSVPLGGIIYVVASNAGHSMAIALALALLAGVGVGLVNGLLVVFLRIDSLIATLGTSTFISGVILWISNSQTVSGIDERLIDLVVVDRFLGIPLEFYYGVALGLVMLYVFEFMPIGRRLLFVGRGRSVARLSGIRVRHLRWGALVASGMISAFAGVL